MNSKISTILAVFGLCTSCQADDGIRLLSPKEYDNAVRTDTSAVILDVRQPSEYADGHIKGAKSLDILDPKIFSEGVDRLVYLLQKRQKKSRCRNEDEEQGLQGCRHEGRHHCKEGGRNANMYRPMQHVDEADFSCI